MFVGLMAIFRSEWRHLIYFLFRVKPFEGPESCSMVLYPTSFNIFSLVMEFLHGPCPLKHNLSRLKVLQLWFMVSNIHHIMLELSSYVHFY
jgi:hypothetical protein